MRWIAWSALLVLAACFSESDVPGSGSAADDGSTHGTGTTCGADGHCGEASTGSSSASSPSTTAATADAEAETTPPETSSGSSSDGSGTVTSITAEGDISSGGGVCGDDDCIGCVQCAFAEMECKPLYDACLGDSSCDGAFACTQDCLAGPMENLPACVTSCGCTGGDAQIALVDCVAHICVGNGSCPQLPCGTRD